jgi:hypothetical protein
MNEIKLLNGDIINGTIERETETTLKVRTDKTSTILINKRLVAKK